MSVNHYDKLFRIHSMLAMIASDAAKEKELALDAQFFVLKMWEQTLQTQNAVYFLEQNKEKAEELGYKDGDKEARAEFYN